MTYHLCHASLLVVGSVAMEAPKSRQENFMVRDHACLLTIDQGRRNPVRSEYTEPRRSRLAGLLTQGTPGTVG